MSNDDPADWSEKRLAQRLRAKRLGVEPDHRTSTHEKIIATLREINFFVLSPWISKDHPWTKGAAKPGEPLPTPAVMREMGANAIAYFEGYLHACTPPDSNDVLLDEIDYRRAPSVGRTEQMLNEVRWFIDGQLALAWNVVAHRKAIEAFNVGAFDGGGDEFALKRAMRLCWRVNQKRSIEFAISFGRTHEAQTRPDFVQFAGGVRYKPTDTGLDTVWGTHEGPNYAFKDGIAYVAALNVVHRFKALV